MNARTAGPVAAGILCAVVFGGLVAIGSVRPPDFISLQRHPDHRIEGTIAFVRTGGDEHASRHCLFTVPASGGPERRLRCSDDWMSLTGWSGDGLVVVSAYENEESRTLYLDPHTGRVQRHGETGPYTTQHRFDDDAWLSTLRADGDVSVVAEAAGQQRVLLRATEAPRDYTFESATWSPDDEWIMVTDSEDRVIIVDRDGGDARLLVEDAESPAWYLDDGHASDGISSSP